MLFKEVRHHQYSQESIDYQFNNNFFLQLAKAIGKARELNSRELTTGANEVKEIGDLITDFLGIKVDCHISPARYYNAWVKLPDFNKNHPFFEMFQNQASSAEGLKLLGSKEFDIGNVNRKTGKISGVYAKVQCPITFTKGLMTAKTFTNEEIAAIALHEIGHIYSLFETMYRTIGVNLAVSSAMEECIGTKDPTVKMRVIKGLREKGIIDNTLDESAIAQLDDEKLPVVVITAAFKQLRHDGNAVCYNRTAWEQSADQFAVRMGAGTALASGLNKILPDSSKMKYLFVTNSLEKLIWKVFYKTMQYLSVISGVYIVAIWFMLCEFLFIGVPNIFEVSHNTYDRHKDRVARIRREQIGKLKLLDKDDPLREEVLQQIDEIKEIEDNQSNLYSDAFAYGYAFVYNFLTGQLDKKAQQQAIEKLMNNELYVQAARFKVKGK